MNGQTRESPCSQGTCSQAIRWQIPLRLMKRIWSQSTRPPGPPSTERQQVDSAHAELAASQAPVAKAAATGKGVAPVSSVAPNRAQSPKVVLQEKVLLPAGSDGAKALSSSKPALPGSSEKGNVSKQPPTRQSSSAAAAAGRTPAPPARSAPPAAAKSPPIGEKGPLAPSTGPSGSSASKQAQPGKTLKSLGAHAPSPSKAKQATQVPGSSAEGPPLATAAAQGRPASGKVPSSSELPAKHPSQQLSSPVSSQQRPTAPGKSAAQPKTAPAVAPERSTKLPGPFPQPPSVAVKSPAPKQSSAALTDQAAAAASPSLTPGNTPSSSKSQVQSSLAAAASNVKAQAVQPPVVSSIQPPPASTSNASMRKSIPAPLQADPQDPPIPGLACLENPMTAPSVLPLTAAGPSRPGTAPGQPEQMVLQSLSSWVPPPPAEAPPQLPQVPSDPCPPEPSSPRPAPMARDPSKKRSRGAAEPGAGNGPTPPSDSGEDMDIDDEAAPPLPTEPFPQGFELATINSNQELVELSGEERGSLLDELSGIHVRHHLLLLSSGHFRVTCHFTVPHCNAGSALV